jgi:flavin reductase (DIM6/NTAB) family NADH-FMN oxidoreductase RutF
LVYIEKTIKTVELKMVRHDISIKDFDTKIFHAWDKKWFLLTSGDFTKNDYNSMTVAWGSFGVMWNKPFAQVVVRPTRYTYEFMEKYDSFTLTAFPADYKKALQLLGSKSGRDGDKIAESGLTPIASQKIAAPVFEEAHLILECQKIYWQDFDPSNFIDPGIEKNYPKKDYHRIYFGEIVTILQG